MKASIKREGDVLLITLNGDFRDDTDEQLKSLLEKIESPAVHFDTFGIELINSMGTRAWVDFAQSLRRRKTNLRFNRCSTAFVEAANQTKTVARPNEIHSLVVPGHCKNCSRDISEVRDAAGLAPDTLTLTCPQCSRPAALVVDAETYLMCLMD
jgi:anti-anti-sigma regulatory factor